MAKLLSIGEFSTISRLTIKTLRFYHEKGLLIPVRIDGSSGYRFYTADQVETAIVIRRLRDLGFSVREIQELLAGAGDECDILAELEAKYSEVSQRAAENRRIQKTLSQIIQQVKQERQTMAETTFEIQEKSVDPVLVAGLRMRGRYSDCGSGYARVGKLFGSKICGKAMLLCYDEEYKEDDADYEVCMPVRGGTTREDVQVYELPAGRCVSLVHRGPYDSLGRSYEKVMSHVRDKGYEVKRPCREVYLKGPGMIFRGNPKKYLTEIQIMVEPREA